MFIWWCFEWVGWLLLYVDCVFMWIINGLGIDKENGVLMFIGIYMGECFMVLVEVILVNVDFKFWYLGFIDF